MVYRVLILKLNMFLLCLMMSLGSDIQAQSAGDIQLKVHQAKQQGYSNSLMESVNNHHSSNSAGTQVGATDRNAAALQQQQLFMQQQEQMRQNYGVSGSVYPLSSQGQQLQLSQFHYGPDAIYGHEIFKNKNLNFIPSYNIPTPDNYKLAPGDELIIDIWGDVISNIRAVISPDGSINIPNLGPVYLTGQTVEKAEKSLKSYLGKIYSGIAQDDPTTFVKLSVGKTKTVTVNVVGDVEKPGSYTLPALSTIASAIYLAEGPNEIGTVRQINLYRNGKLVSSFDVYEFIAEGTFNSNVKLEDNDLISVSPYSGVVTVTGGVKRPMRYEIKPGETLDKVLAYAGGFSDVAHVQEVHVDRIVPDSDKQGAVGESFDVRKEDFSSFQLKDGDVVTVNENEDRFSNRVKIAGAVWRPGTYAINSNISNLKQLISAAGGLKDDAYIQKGFIVRFGEGRAKEQVSFNLTDVILGKDNILLHPDDSVQIFTADSLKSLQTVKIFGEINKPDGYMNYLGEPNTFEFREGMTIGDLILMAGGPTDAATLSKVEIARRLVRHPSDDMVVSDTIATLMYYNLLKNPSDSDVKLEPYDIVFVRRSVSYKPQQTITVEGEVNYPGQYVVEKNVVRLSDVIEKAQGFNKDAYVQGAKLTRMLTKEEFERLKVAMAIAKKHINDTTAVDSLEIGESYTVAIDLDRAIKSPGSVEDVILREGDIISVPKFNSTVKISGAVLYPNTVAYNPGKSWKYYISNAGGVNQDGMRGKTYMVHMNGSVAARGRQGFDVQPGTEIIVPSRDKAANGQSIASILGIATSTASLAAMVTTIINQIK